MPVANGDTNDGDPVPAAALPNGNGADESVGRTGTHMNLRQKRSNALRDGRYQFRDAAYLIVKKAKSKYQFSKLEVGLNITVKKALKTMPRKAVNSIIKELVQLVDMDVWDPMMKKNLKEKQLKKIIRSSMFLKEKYLSTGQFEKLKARLVAGGHMQDRSLYTENDRSSPTVASDSVQMIAHIAAVERRKVKCCDITGAYLNATLKNVEVLMKLDKTLSEILVELYPEYNAFLNGDGTIIVKLKRALYGCVESAKLWYNLLRKTLESIGFTANQMDPCVFNMGEGDEQCTVCFHVDDLMITCKNEATVDMVIEKLRQEFKTITVHDGRALCIIKSFCESKDTMWSEL